MKAALHTARTLVAGQLPLPLLVLLYSVEGLAPIDSTVTVVNPPNGVQLFFRCERRHYFLKSKSNMNRACVVL